MQIVRHYGGMSCAGLAMLFHWGQIELLKQGKPEHTWPHDLYLCSTTVRGGRVRSSADIQFFFSFLNPSESVSLREHTHRLWESYDQASKIRSDLCPPGDSASPRISSFCYSYLSMNGTLEFRLMCSCGPSRSSWERGRHAAQVLSHIFLDPHSSNVLEIYFHFVIIVF